MFWILGVAAITLVFVGGISRLKLRTDGTTLYPTHNRIIDQTEADRTTFHDPQQVILLVTSATGGPQVASPAGIRFVRNVHQSIREVRGVRGDGVRSLANVPDMRANLGTMAIASVVDRYPDDSAEFADMLNRLHQHPLTDGLFLSKDGQAAAIYVPLAEDAQRQEFLREVKRWIAAQNTADFELRLMGPVVAEATLGDMVLRDLAWLIPLMVAVVAVVLFLTLRTVGGVLMPLIQALTVLVWTFGLMGYLGVPVTLVTTIMPVILMTMSIADEIHLMQSVQTHFIEATYRGGHPATRQALAESTASALHQMRRPIVGTSLTTGIGFLSFLTASLVPMQQFGLFTAFGVLLAMVLSFTLIPALIVVLPPKWFVRWQFRPNRERVHTAEPWDRIIARHSRAGLLIGLLLVVAAVPGVLKLAVQDSWVDNFDPDAELVVAEREFNARFWGSYRFDVIFRGEPAIFLQTKGARLIEEFSRLAAAGPHVGGVMSYLTPFREIAQGIGLTGDLSDLPEGQINDLATMAESSTDPMALRQVLSEDGTQARVCLFVNSPNYDRSEELQEYLEGAVTAVSSPDAPQIHFSGDIPVSLEVVRSIVSNQLQSVGGSLIGIALLFYFFFARGRAALVALLPVSTAALLVFGAMGFGGMPLGIATSMFASMAVGGGVDFALHFLHNYRREMQNGHDHQNALLNTLGHSGQAIRWNALVLALGFLVLTFSAIKPDRSLGLLLAGAIAACYLTTVLFLPGLVRFTVKAGLILVCLAALPGLASAQALPSATADQSAHGLMHTLEQDFRSLPRAVKMEFSTIYSRTEQPPIERTMWGICNGDSVKTKMLYVVTEPARMRGTTLLFHDEARPDRPDSTWLYLPAFRRVGSLHEQFYGALVPGTALTYEDSRGFIPIDKYDFSFVDGHQSSDSDEILIKADPRDENLRTNLGFQALVVRIDRQRE
ncbi:MAG TPA: MMPL family transporter, partial [Candidatus Deferrimicrobium sp.]|nr:MMPL family transporter [Candidatus Deferrimicrobium sp.]